MNKFKVWTAQKMKFFVKDCSVKMTKRNCLQLRSNLLKKCHGKLHFFCAVLLDSHPAKNAR